MSHARRAALLAALILVTLVPAAPAEPDAFTAGLPRVGEEVTFRETFAFDVRPEWDFSVTTTHRWTAEPALRLDALRHARMVAPLAVSGVYEQDGMTFGFGGATWDADADTRQIVGYQGQPPRTVQVSIGLPQARLRAESTTPGEYNHIATSFVPIRLQGHTLAAGESITDAYELRGLGALTLTFTGLGWAGDIFLVRVTYDYPDIGYTYHETHHHRQGETVPFFAQGQETWVEDGETIVGTYTLERQAYAPGAGAPVHAPGYAAPTDPAFQGDVLWTTWTPDGPAEDVLETVPLPRAVEAARAHPQAAAWLAARAEAFVSSAAFEEDEDDAQVRWRVTFAEGAARLRVDVVSAWLPGGATAPPVATTVSQATAAPWDTLERADVVGRTVACARHADALARDGAVGLGEGEPVARTGSVSATALDGVRCRVRVERLSTEHAIEGAALVESWPHALADVSGATGALVREARGEASGRVGLVVSA